ncbi:MAG: hypothetical protein F8N39_17915 [Clostridiaceae bacterium]|nr:hypothetical protein [Clostridiaceae bacterium]
MSENYSSKLEMFHELSCYSSSHSDPKFIHQHVVDAFALETADEETKNIKVVFALIGLFLHVEKNFTGKEVQNAHIQLGKRNKNWPKLVLPINRGDISIKNVMECPEGLKRDMAIEKLCISIWDSYSHCHEYVEKLVQENLWRGK